MINHIVKNRFTHFIIAACLLFAAQSGYALDIQVTKYNDTLDGSCDSDCSLREAVELANNTPGRDRILLNSGTYVVDIPTADMYERVDEEEGWYEVIQVFLDEDDNQNSDLDITDDVTIEGFFDGTTVIDGAKNGRLFEILAGDVTLTNLTLTNGKQSYGRDAKGGAIENHASLTLRYCNLLKNVISGGEGGAIYNWGTLKIHSSNINENVVTHYRESNIFVPNLLGSAIFNRGTLTVRDSTFRKNDFSTYLFANAPTLYNSGTADIRRSLFTENRPGESSSVIKNVGGTLKIVSSTFSHNVGVGSKDENVNKGAGVITTVNNILGEGKLYLTNVTIADHAFYGLNLIGDAYIRNSIIAGNARPEDGQAKNCYRVSGSLEMYYTLLGNGANPNCVPTINNSNTSILKVDNNRVFVTVLDALANNGGPTLSHALRRINTNPAIDRVTDGNCPNTDQRGQPTGVEGNNNDYPGCDLGAYELQP